MVSCIVLALESSQTFNQAEALIVKRSKNQADALILK